jgi:5-methylthioadenosine/S-adenosylhomocysteine deaminase
VRTIVADTPDDLDPIVTAVEQGRGFIYHLCEGTDPDLLEEYTLVDGVGLVQRLLIAIHGTALQQTQLDALAAARATLVWSPFSNLWLYGTRRVHKCVHAACRYSCTRPPSRSRRWTRAG